MPRAALESEDGLANPSSAQYARWVKGLARRALEPEPAFANLKSLAFLEDAFFTFWNESTGAHVRRFWHSIAERGLPFERKDIVGDVLLRGRIRTRIEYDHVTDGLVVLRQEGKISATEQRRLSAMLDEYEARSRRR